MKPVAPELTTLLDRARIYAALHDSFLPQDAILWANGGTLPDDTQTLARLFSMLRPDCTRQDPTPSGPARWTMRPGARRKRLTSGLLDSIADIDFDTPIGDALRGKGPYAPAKLDALLRAPDLPDNLPRIVATLDRAGPRAKGHDRLVALRGILNRFRAEKRTDAILGDGFVGRQDELSRLADWIAQPQSHAPLRALYISGIAGIGKSFLLEQSIQMARAAHHPIFVRLDFDRSGLNVLNRESFFDEISRQVGDGLPDMALRLRELRLKIAEKDAPQTSASETLPQDTLIGTLAHAVRDSGRMLVIILDTLEVLRSTGETRIEALFENLDLLSHAGIDRISIIAAGRGNALEPAPKRQAGKPILLMGLSDIASEAFLHSRNVSRQHWPRIIALARGNPLFLLLASKAVEQDDFDADALPRDATDQTIGSYLYRAILSRVPDPLRDVATEALLLNTVTADTLLNIIAPVVTPTMTKAQAQDAFNILKTQYWLVTPDPTGQAVQHRIDVRRAFLPMLYEADPETAAKINRRACIWYQGRDRLQHLYHALQLTRAGDALPDVPGDLALEFDEFMLQELPPRAGDAVRHAQGRRSDFGRAGDHVPDQTPIATSSQTADDRPWLQYAPSKGRLKADRLSAPGALSEPDQRAIDDLEILLRKRDLREAEFVLDNAMRGAFAPDGRLAQLMLCHFWLTGRWSAAEKLLDRQPPGTLETAIAEKPLLQGRVLLEMRAEFHFDALVARLRKPEFLQLALRVHHDSARTGLQGGALDFALLCVLGPGKVPQDLSLAHGILAHNGRDDWPAAENLLHQARARQLKVARPGQTPETRFSDPVRTAHELAILNPYAAPIGAFLQRGISGALLSFTENTDTLPRAAAALYAQTRTPITNALPDRYFTATDLAHGFNALGLTAEWATGFASFNPVPDFPHLARSADRWRRLCAGDWQLGRTRPADWQGVGVPDRVTLARASDMLAGPNPAQAATDRLFLWSAPTHTRPEAAAHLLRRYATRTTRSAEATGALPASTDRTGRLKTALGTLIGAGVPPLMASPLAVLIVLGTPLRAALLPNT